MPISANRAPQKKFFLTGATGLVGSYLLKVLLEKGHVVYALCRGSKGVSARARLEERLRFWGVGIPNKNLIIIEGDVSSSGLGLAEDSLRRLIVEVEEIIHCAAITDLNRPQDEIERVNVGGTREVFNFALECKALSKIHHISTAYVFGNYTGVFTENDLDVGQKFNTTYEASKYKAELMVNEFRDRGLWINVYRPSIVIGESSTGKTFQLKHIYQFLNLCKLEIFDSLPVKGAFLSLVPVDTLAQALYALLSGAEERNACFHPFPKKLMPLEDIISAGSVVFGFKKPRLVSAEEFDAGKLTPAQRAILQSIIFPINFQGKLKSDLTALRLNKLGVPMIDLDKKDLEQIISKFAKLGKV